MIKALRYLGRISASAAAELLETLVPRRKSPAEQFFALCDVLMSDFDSQVIEGRAVDAGARDREW